VEQNDEHEDVRKMAMEALEAIRIQLPWADDRL
jgi:hypothetical protein